MSQPDVPENGGSPRRSTDLTRREVLAGVASAGVLPGTLPKLFRPGSEVVDVLVVGGGVSGCYAAWRPRPGIASRCTSAAIASGDACGR